MDAKGKSLADRIEHHRQMAQGYLAAQLKHDPADGAGDQEWTFALHAEYWCSYLDKHGIDLSLQPMSVREIAEMETAAYCVDLPNWALLGFECWPSEKGFVMQRYFSGQDQNGRLYDFYAYGFVETNGAGEVTRWETHVSPEYNHFLNRERGQ